MSNINRNDSDQPAHLKTPDKTLFFFSTKHYAYFFFISSQKHEGTELLQDSIKLQDNAE